MSRNIKLQQIEEGEKQLVNLISQEAQTRREFEVDGLDEKEKKILNNSRAKIAKVRNGIDKLRKEIETNKRAWEQRGTEWQTASDQSENLINWPIDGASIFRDAFNEISIAIRDERWKDALDQLDQVQVNIKPFNETYDKQVAARDEFDPLMVDTRNWVDDLFGVDLISEPILENANVVYRRVNEIKAQVADGDYVTGLEALKTARDAVEDVAKEIAALRQEKAAYDAAWSAVQLDLAQVNQCVFPALTPRQQDILTLQDHIVEIASDHQYVEANKLIPDLKTTIDTYMAEYTQTVEEQTLYETRLAAIQPEISDAMVSEFPALAPQQTEIDGVVTAMEAAASEADYTTALLELDKLVPLIDAYKLLIEQAQLGQEFEGRMAEMANRFVEAAVSTYGPLDELATTIDATRQEAESSGAAGEYGAALDTLDYAATQLDKYDALLDAIEQAKIEYDSKLDGVLSRTDAISQCEYTELDASSLTIIELRDAMVKAAEMGDYPNALKTLLDLDATVNAVGVTLTELNAKRAEYDRRLPGLVTRFDSLMMSDFTELEDERKDLQAKRTAMETAYTATDMRAALSEMDGVERALDDLDAQLGNLINIQDQYRETYNTIKGDLATVEACTHPELKVKRDPIIEQRDAMLAAANATDFATALELVKKLIGPVVEFLELEELLQKYTEALKAITSRLETVRGYEYKSLEDDKKEIEDLFTKMTDAAANAELADAIKMMEELNAKVTALMALYAEMQKQEIIFKKLHDDMKGDIETVRKNEIEGAKDAAEKVIACYDKMVEDSSKDEFIEAVKKADTLKKTLIPNFLKAVSQHGTEEEIFKTTSEFANTAYDKAEGKSKEYPDDLKAPFEDLKGLKDEMTAAGEAKNFVEGTAKAKSLIAEITKFDALWLAITKREADLTARVDKTTARFDALPKEAKDKASDEYTKAKGLVSDLKSQLADKEFDDVESTLETLSETLDDIDEALKTQGEHEAEYNGLKNTLGQRVSDAEGSIFKDYLTDEITAVTEAFGTMTGFGDVENYGSGVDAAKGVETALTAFNAAEDVLEQKKARFDERIKLLTPQFVKATKITALPLISEVVEFSSRWHVAVAAGDARDYDEAIKLSEDFGTDLTALLDEAQKLKDESEEEDESLFEKVADKALDFIKDQLIDRAKNYVGKKISNVIETAYNVAENLWNGNYWQAAFEAAKGLYRAHPFSDHIEAAREVASKLIDEVFDTVLKTALK